MDLVEIAVRLQEARDALDESVSSLPDDLPPGLEELSLHAYNAAEQAYNKACALLGEDPDDFPNR